MIIEIKKVNIEI
jgi:siroheme synthase (precorrin-2 oxidase/ferrochelatase)